MPYRFRWCEELTFAEMVSWYSYRPFAMSVHAVTLKETETSRLESLLTTVYCMWEELMNYFLVLLLALGCFHHITTPCPPTPTPQLRHTIGTTVLVYRALALLAHHQKYI